MVIPADRSGLLTTSEMEKAIALIRNSVYTKNGFSLADIYDKDGRYDQTVGVTFSADGKSAYVLNVKYTIKEGNVLEIVPEGNVVYLYYEENGENEYIRGTLNDNGMFYLYIVQTDESGAVTAEHLIFAYVWIGKDGVIIVYENGNPLIKGTIVDGYLVIDHRFPRQIPSSGKIKSNRETGAESKQKFCFLCAPLPEINQKVNKIKNRRFYNYEKTAFMLIVARLRHMLVYCLQQGC